MAISGKTRQSRFVLRRSNVPNNAPTTSQLLLGELAFNTADVKLYGGYTGGVTGLTEATEIKQIGWDRLSTESGGTVNGDVTINGDLTVNGNTSLSGITTDYIDFNTTWSGNTLEGRLHWDINNGGPTIGMEGGNVSQQIGQEIYYYIKNQSGATIENGKVVKAVGTVGSSGKILGEYMIADGSTPSKFTLGIATENILNGTDGFVTEFGLVRGFDTTGTPYGETWNDGDVLYVSSTIVGGLTNVEPVAPGLHIEMAIVIDADVNGSIFVRPNRYPHFYDLQEAAWSAGTENNLDVIQWDSSNNTFNLTNTPLFNSISATTISADTFYGSSFGLTGLFTGFTLTAPNGSPQSVTNGQSILFNTSSGLTASIEGTRSVVYRLDINNTPIEASPTTGDKLLLYDASSGEHRNIDWGDLPGAGGGENNTASNIGVGFGLYKQKVGVDLQFRSLSAGTNVTITTGDTVVISASGGGSSRIENNVATSDATPTELDKIDTIPVNATSIIEVYIKAYESGAAQYGVWKRTLTVTKVSDVVVIREENADVDKTSSGLNANSINFTVNGADIDIDVTGIAATTIKWESAYEIIL
jgi:hypothetical protein